MASENFIQVSIPRFDGHCDHWSMLMKNFLRSEEYWKVVHSGVIEPSKNVVLSAALKAELEDLKLKDLRAKNYLFQAIDCSILETILSKETSKDIWDSMKKKYQGSTRDKRQQLQAFRSEFELLRMFSGESVNDFFARTMALVNKIQIHGEKFTDVTIVEKILRCLTPKFNYVVCTIEESKDLDVISIGELQRSLLVHEQRMNHHYAEGNLLSDERLLMSRYSYGKGKDEGKFSQSCSICKRTNHVNCDCWFKDNKRQPLQCYHCKKFGHIEKFCREKLKFEQANVCEPMNDNGNEVCML